MTILTVPSPRRRLARIRRRLDRLDRPPALLRPRNLRGLIPLLCFWNILLIYRIISSQLSTLLVTGLGGSLIALVLYAWLRDRRDRRWSTRLLGIMRHDLPSFADVERVFDDIDIRALYVALATRALVNDLRAPNPARDFYRPFPQLKDLLSVTLPYERNPRAHELLAQLDALNLADPLFKLLLDTAVPTTNGTSSSTFDRLVTAYSALSDPDVRAYASALLTHQVAQRWSAPPDDYLDSLISAAPLLAFEAV